MEGQRGRQTASLAQKPATTEPNRTEAALSHTGSCGFQRGLHSRCAERDGDHTEKTRTRTRPERAFVCTKVLQHLATGAAGEAELPDVQEPQLTAIPDPEPLAFPEPQLPAIPNSELHTVPDSQPTAIPDPELLTFPEHQPPGIPDPELLSVSEPQPPAIPYPELLTFPEAHLAAIPDTEPPVFPKPQPFLSPSGPQTPRLLTSQTVLAARRAHRGGPGRSRTKTPTKSSRRC